MKNKRICACEVLMLSAFVLLGGIDISFAQTRDLNYTPDMIDADLAWNAGYSGNGWSVAIVDTGIMRTHEFFTQKTIEEACASSYFGYGQCPNTDTMDIGTDTAAHHAKNDLPAEKQEFFDRGTRLAGIVAGNKSTNDGTVYPKYGIARGANIVAINVFSFNTLNFCSSITDQIQALDYIINNSSTFKVASVLMPGDMLCETITDADCTNPASNVGILKARIATLKAAKIPTIVAAGDSNSCSIPKPWSCIPDVIVVGASNKSDALYASGNVSSSNDQEFFAPGAEITTPTADTATSYTIGTNNGTAFAAAHVAGAWAILRQKDPTASVDTIAAALSNNSPFIPAAGATNPCVVYKPRINIYNALTALSSTNSYLLWTK